MFIILWEFTIISRFILLISFILIVALGIYSLFFINVDNPPIVTQNSDISADKSDIKTYHKFIVADDWRLRELLLNIANHCADYDKLCVVMNTYYFVKHDIIFNPKLLNLSPTQTAKIKEGSINDKAILFASLLKNANFDIKMTYNEDKLYPVLCDINEKELFNSIIKWQKSHLIIDKKITLNKGKTYALWLDNEEIVNAKSVTIEYVATKPINFIQFLNETELALYLKDNSGRYFNDCAIFDNSSAEIKCSTPEKTLLAFLSQYDNNSIDIKIRPSNVILSDIKTAIIREKKCIPFDFSADNLLQYPGIINFDAERLTAIGR